MMRQFRAQFLEAFSKSEESEDLGVYCAKVLQSLPNPRDLLRAVADKHPGVCEEQLSKLFEAELEFHPDMQKAIDVEVVQRLWAEKFSEGARDQQRQASHH